MHNESLTRRAVQPVGPSSTAISDAGTHHPRTGLTASTICEAAAIIVRTAGGHADEAIEELSRESRLLGLSMRELADALIGEQHGRVLSQNNSPLRHQTLIG